jgi:hypothetical protein
MGVTGSGSWPVTVFSVGDIKSSGSVTKGLFSFLSSMRHGYCAGSATCHIDTSAKYRLDLNGVCMITTRPKAAWAILRCLQSLTRDPRVHELCSIPDCAIVNYHNRCILKNKEEIHPTWSARKFHDVKWRFLRCFSSPHRLTKPISGHTHTPIKSVQEVFSPGAKQSRREADQSPSPSVEVKNRRSLRHYFHPSTSFHDMVLN